MASDGKGFKAPAQGRSIGGFSLRRSLEDQGVTTEEGMRKHLNFVDGTLKGCPTLDIVRYRVNKNNPNELPEMG